MAAGYSGTPLFKKLGFKAGQIVKLINPPSHYQELVGDAYKDLLVKNKATSDIDLVHFFTNTGKEFKSKLDILKQQLKKDGTIWISWYKKSTKKPTELTEDIIRNYALEIGLVDVKVCAVDEEWSALKLVYRLKDR
jgi:hypothetical protein